MLNRRQALLAMGGASAGALGLFDGVSRAWSQPATKPPRREIFIGGKRIKTIDMHCHCFISEVIPLLKGTPLERVGASGQAQTLIGPFHADRRTAQMDADGVDVQVLGINTFWYRADRDLARRINDVQNEKLRDIVSNSKGRFEAYTAVALQFPDLAAAQLEHGIKQLGLKGAFISCDVGDDELSARKFDPFWAKAEELDVPVMIHPQSSATATGITKRIGHAGALSNVIGNPLQTSFALAHLIFDGTLDRFPKLKIIAAHGGGYLPSYAGRMDHGCEVFPKQCQGPKLQKKPSDYFKQIYVDSLVFTDEGLRHLVAECGVGQIVLGSDSPVPWVKDPVGHITNAHSISDTDRVAILHDNASRLLKLQS